MTPNRPGSAAKLNSEGLLPSVLFIWEGSRFHNIFTSFPIAWDKNSNFLTNIPNCAKWRWVNYSVYGVLVPICCLLILLNPNRFHVTQVAISAIVIPVTTYFLGILWDLKNENARNLVLAFWEMRSAFKELGKQSQNFFDSLK